ncbi:MAG: peptidoglycan DD-metalloendopeptidase family protein [Burkholderiaceae bacterium]
MTFTILRSMMSRDVKRSLAFLLPSLVIACAMVGCASRSLSPPPVIERSSNARTTAAPPGTVVTSPDGRTQLYTVNRDDTLFSIARRFNTTPAELASWNNLGTDPRIAVAQVLRVSPPTAAATGADNAPIAVTQPVGNESVEQRPLGTPPPGSPPLAAPTHAPSNAPLKTAPLGLKRPYSGTTLAEFSRPEAGAAPSSAGVPEPAKPQAAEAATRLAWAWPANGKVVDTFVEGKTKGIDIAGKSGEGVLAAADGKVIFSGRRVRGYGNFVIVWHSADLLSVYAHNKTNLVKEDAVVTRGQKIAEMGNSDADSVKLHFEIRQGGKPVDPLRFLPER